MARMEEIKWLTCAAELNKFIPDKSWSAFNARKDESEITTIVNSMLTLPRQNIGAYSIQKHSIKISKAIIDVLNPSQVLIDTSYQPMFFQGNFSIFIKMNTAQENICLCLIKNCSWKFMAY